MDNCRCATSFTGLALNGTQVCGSPAFMTFLTLVDNVLRSDCSLVDACRRVQEPQYVCKEYDFIVVGSGWAGSAVAARLAEAKYRVLLLEAGQDEPVAASCPAYIRAFWGTELDYNIPTQPEQKACLGYPQRKCNNAVRGKVLGGCSVVNHMVYARGNRHDYARWESFGNPGWGWDGVLPFFIKSENNLEYARLDPAFHGVGGPVEVSRFNYHPRVAEHILAAAKEIGYPITDDINGRNGTGFAILQAFQGHGRRMSASRAYIRPKVGNPYLQVMLRSLVSRVLVDPVSKKAFGVEFSRYGRRHIVFANKEVVLSAGVFGSPHILMLSGIGPKHHLRHWGISVINELPGVGENLHNHVSYELNVDIPEPDVNELDRHVLDEYIHSKTGPLSAGDMSQTTALLSTKFASPAGDDPDIQLFFSGYEATCSRTGSVGELASNGMRRIAIKPTLIKPLSRGSVRLQSTDPLIPPLIFQNLFANRRDLETLSEGIRIAEDLLNAPLLKEGGFRRVPEFIPACNSLEGAAQRECLASHLTMPDNHQGGTCMMASDSNPKAVVDHRLRVYGIKGLRVADTSVMPTSPSGNTAAPTLMIGEKAARMIIEDWAHKPPNKRPCQRHKHVG